MAATREDIAGWFDQGRKIGCHYMIVVCDTFDHEDYPVFCETAEKALVRMKSPGEMQRVMECYDLKADKAEQMSQHRTMALSV